MRQPRQQKPVQLEPAATTWPLDATEQLLGVVQSRVWSIRRVSADGRRAIGGGHVDDVWRREGHVPEQLAAMPGCYAGQQRE